MDVKKGWGGVNDHDVICKGKGRGGFNDQDIVWVCKEWEGV